MALAPYRTVAAPAEDEFTEKKSRFIGYIAPVTTEQEATAFIESVRARHREARHNCYAYRLRQNNLARFSDDGEPSGTAGRPGPSGGARPPDPAPADPTRGAAPPRRRACTAPAAAPAATPRRCCGKNRAPPCSSPRV